MFGYININKDELSPEDQRIYQSYYWGICRHLKKENGIKGDKLLTFDMTFLTILLSDLYKLEDEVEEDVLCPLHPFQKVDSRINEATKYAASMNVLLSYYRFQNKWTDYRSLPKKTLASMFRKQHQDIEKEYPRQGQAVKRYLMKLSVAESGNEKNLDVMAGLTGELFSELYSWKNDEWKEELQTFGYYMGKFIYLMSVYETVDRDESRKLYNPLIIEKSNKSEKDFDLFVKLLLLSMNKECEKSFLRMPILFHGTILRNIIYSGMLTQYGIIKKGKNKKQVDR